MPFYSFGQTEPNLEPGCYVSESVDLIGDVRLSQNVNIWFNCVLRGDLSHIAVGENTNIQDLSMLHVIKDGPVIIGKNVTIGHKVTLHACTIEDSCLIGMGAIVLDGAVIKKNSLVAAGSVVPPGKSYPEGSLILGNPAKVLRPLTEGEIDQYGNHFKSYLDLKDHYLNENQVKRLN